MRSIRLKENTQGWLFLLPSLVVLAGLIIFPVIYNTNLSLHDAHLLKPGRARFVGLSLYADLLRDSHYWQSIKVGFIWTFFSLLGQLIIGLGLALLINQKFIGRSVVRSLLIVPWVIPSAIVAITWRWMFNDVYGIISYVLMCLGLISEPLNWLGDTSLAMPSVIIVNLWRGFPLMMLLIFARLQTIPEEQYEAARVDGASTWQSFVYITLPNLRTVILIIALLRTIWIFNFFDLVWLLTGGGPLDKTMIPPVFVYLKMFGRFRLGEAAAISITLVVLLLILAIIYTTVLRRTQS